MLCSKCGNETYIDHIIKTEETETYVYVCVNPNCEAYKQAFTILGGAADTQIIEKEIL